jgi:hypothetical protein
VTAYLAFITLFLGLVAGPQPLKLQVNDAVKSVKVVLDGETVATLRGAPWQTVIDFGPELKPRRLTAIAYDAKGEELSRESQLVNVARPSAEVGIALARADKGPGYVARLRWQHLTSERVTNMDAYLDGKPVTVDEPTRTIRLPKLNMKTIHILGARLSFADGTIAGREIVFGGEVVDEAATELTGIAVEQRTASRSDGCLQLEGAPVHVAAVERTRGLVAFVRDSDPTQVSRRLITGKSGSLVTRLPHAFTIPDTALQLFWTVPEEVPTSATTVSEVFGHSVAFDGGNTALGTLSLLARASGPDVRKAPRRADAVAAAAVHALRGGRRRAVVLVLGDDVSDASRHTPATVRRYLQSIGVPFFVWSVAGKTPELEATWGPIEDISSPPALQYATERLRKALERQRIAWVSVDPIAALQVTATADCAYVPIARR